MSLRLRFAHAFKKIFIFPFNIGSDKLKCRMIEQGFEKGACEIRVNGRIERACRSALRKRDGVWFRMIKSAHLSRPEHYFSIYMSGCNLHCLKCHSAEFSQGLNGRLMSTDEIAEMCKEYEGTVTYFEEQNKALMWYATELCLSCGSCVTEGVRSNICPGVLKPEQVVFSPQGFGPARNIIAYTGGDLACCIDYYVQLTEKIKERCKNSFILFETNGYGLTPENLDKLRDAGVNSFWLDIKAFDDDVHRKLCGTSNRHILSLPEEMKERGFVFEVLSLYIPNWVETDQLVKIAGLVAEVDAHIPFTLLAFFPSHKLSKNRAPTTMEIVRAYLAMKDAGLKNLKVGNVHVFARSEEEWALLDAIVGREGIG